MTISIDMLLKVSFLRSTKGHPDIQVAECQAGTFDKASTASPQTLLGSLGSFATPSNDEQRQRE